MPKPNHKETLLAAALAAFHRNGYHATGVQEIVTSAGIPKGSFYAHFESKGALGLAALARYSADRAATRALLRDASLRGSRGSTAISRRSATARMAASSAILR
ncbi:MAG: helix-turn-helix transcriptional regulator, partial [Acetobacteraceae bacterium]|nr:helix-turn-helix transcriptional regulator [Acetobacteraceae bacterium]